MGLKKNTAGQKWLVFAFDRTDNTPKTGDAAQITAKIRIDSGAANGVTDTNPTEVEDGYYEFDLEPGETNGNVLDLLPESATGDVQVIAHPARDFTVSHSATTGRPEVDVYSVSDDAAAATNLELDYDGTGYAKANSQVGAWTDARAVFLDNLNIGENVAGTSEVTSIQNNTRCVRVVPSVVERPDSGSTAYRIELMLYDSEGNMEAPDSAPTITVVNEAGTSRDVNLDATTMTLVSTGRYRSTYTVASSHDIEQLVFTFSVTENTDIRVYGNAALVVDTTAVDFTSSDRSTLDGIAAGQISAADVWAEATRTLSAATNITSDDATIDQTKIANLDVAVSSRLAPTTASRTLDVSANGNAGIDWGNVEAATTTVGLTNTTIGTASALGTGSVTASVIAADAIDADSLKADAVAEIATGLLDLASAIDGKTLRQAISYIGAVAAGKASGAGSGSETFVGLDGATDRVGVTVDDDGNRTAISYYDP